MSRSKSPTKAKVVIGRPPTVEEVLSGGTCKICHQHFEIKLVSRRVHFDTCTRCSRTAAIARGRRVHSANAAARRGETSAAVAAVIAPPPSAPEPATLAPADNIAQFELASRELSRRKLIRFILRRFPKFKAGWFHIDLAAKLDQFVQDVLDGKSPRLLVTAPPRHGKSEEVSVNLPPFIFGRMPDAEIIATSYSSGLANEFSRKVREIMCEEDYCKVLHPGLTLKEGDSSIESWKTTKGGSYVAAGAGGPITGKGAHFLIIEDPFKNFEDASSPVEQMRIWNWYTSTAYTRLAPGGGVIILHTRWCDGDLIGRVLEAMEEGRKIERETGEWPVDYDRWIIVNYPAIATEDEPHRKEGEALHPERYPLSALLKIRRTIGPRDWAALYQQDPVPEEGAYFKAEMLKYYDKQPDGFATLMGIDLAVTTKQYSDYTVFLVGGVDEKDDLYILDGFRGKINSLEIIEQLFTFFKRWNLQLIGGERGLIDRVLTPFLDKRVQETKLYRFRMEGLRIGNKDKEARARSIQGRMAQGKVLWPKGHALLEWAIPEILRFPHARKDDVVDALANLGLMMNEVSYTPAPPPKKASWRDKLKVGGMKQGYMGV